jgi:WD40 repeat protein
MATAGDDDTVRRWNADTGQPVGDPLKGHNGGARSVSISSDGNLLVTGGGNGTVRLWSAETGQQIGDALIGHADRVSKVEISADGRRIARASYDDTVRLWDLNASPKSLCDKLGANMSEAQWRDQVSPDIPYVAVCSDLPARPE